MYYYNSYKQMYYNTVIQYSGTYTYHKYLAFLVYLYYNTLSPTLTANTCAKLYCVHVSRY